MKIMIDCYQLIKGNGKSIGIYNYSKNLLDHLIPIISNEHEIIILTNTKNNDEFTYKNVKNIVIDKLPTNTLVKVLWELVIVSYYIMKNNAEMYFSPRGFLPPFPSKCKMITTVHDLIPVYYKEHYNNEINKLENYYVVNRLKQSCKIADKIITISNFSKKDIVKKFNIDENKIHVIYNGVDLIKNIQRPKNFENEKYIFSISSSSLSHKNLEAILNSYVIYYKKSSNPLKLKICGVKNIDKYKHSVPKECLNNIIILPFISDEELNWYYANANVFLFLSKIEGFGFPPLEALKFSTNVICSDIECLKEILGSEAIMVNANNYEEVARNLSGFEGEKQKNNTSFNNLRRKYDWNDAALKVKSIFKL